MNLLEYGVERKKSKLGLNFYLCLRVKLGLVLFVKQNGAKQLLQVLLRLKIGEIDPKYKLLTQFQKTCCHCRLDKVYSAQRFGTVEPIFNNDLQDPNM